MQFLKTTFENNIWKYFIYEISQRRNFFPILSIFFLTLPNTEANQIGLYTAIGSILGLFIEIPSGYLSDNIGYKYTLVISKLFMLISLIFFITANSVYFFILGSIFQALGWGFDSGTKQAFFHETLIQLGREKEYVKLRGKISANVALLSAFIIVLLPFSTSIDIKLPLIISLGFDAIGLCTTLTLAGGKNRIERHDQESIFSIFHNTKKLGFLPFAIFTGAISGTMIAETAYRSIYLESLGYPIIFIGAVMGLSRVIWFIVGHTIHKIDKIVSMKKLFLIEIVIFGLYYSSVSFFYNPYLVGFIFSLGMGYLWGRSSLLEDYVLRYYTHNKKYKATILSIKGQFSSILETLLTFFSGFIMVMSYKLGFSILGLILICILIVSYMYIKDEQVEMGTFKTTP